MATAQQSGVPVNTNVVEASSDPTFVQHEAASNYTNWNGTGGDSSAPSAPPTLTYTFAQPWFYLFQSLWRKLGGQYSTPQTMVYAQQTAPLEVTFYSVNDGSAVGKIALTAV